MQRLPKTLLSVVAVLFAYPLATHAMPSVSGNTLTWPQDNSWYQVQDAETFETVCEGAVPARASVSGGPCVIGSGRYIVINHSTGERFENVTAGSVSGDINPSTVVVDGSRISWPDDGWYQVLDESNYTEVCSGSRSCMVAPGSYLVINHTTGERFEGIVVAGAVSTPASSISVNENVVSWPSDGWYQVQSAVDFETVCEGGTSCSIPAGSYIVINHSNGMRWEDVTVDGPGTTTTVEFDITVPAYSSDALQLSVQLGDSTVWADWVQDESWSATGDFPVSTENPLVITFYDRNGDITLGSYERGSITVTNASGVYSLTAGQFDTERWDDDGDGVSNLDELVAGSDPLVAGTTGEFNLADVSVDLLLSSAGYQLNRLAGVVDDMAFIIGQTTTITWPDTDWYQVQIEGIQPTTGLREVYATVCNGGTECKLLPGMHALINHTTGERSNLDLPHVSVEDQPHAIQLSDSTYTSTHPSYESTTVTMNRTQYECEHGGSMIQESGRGAAIRLPGGVYGGSVAGPTYSNGAMEPHRYVFDQCRMTVRDGLLPNDNYLMQGQLETVFMGRLDSVHIAHFEEFSIIGDSGLEYHVDGSTTNYDGYYLPYGHTATVSNYQKILPAGQIGESLIDVQYDYGGQRGFLLTTNGVISNELTANQRVTLNTLSPLQYLRSNGSFELLTPFTGSMELLAEDGSSAYLSANPTPEMVTFREVFFLDVAYTTNSGEQTQQRSELGSHSRTSGTCSFGRNRNTLRMGCATGFRRGYTAGVVVP